MSERFYIGTGEAIEAEFGATDINNSAFVVYETYNNEPVGIEGFASLEAAKRSLIEIEDRSTIEYFV